VTHARFNPRARAGRDLWHPIPYPPWPVSIHAPARGATGLAWCGALSDWVSIHAPARGATQNIVNNNVIRGVSIHAPARGATRIVFRRVRKDRSFNPRARAGRDRYRRTQSPPQRCFNPRARAGRDTDAPGASWTRLVSIHAPARGATEQLSGGLRLRIVSIHAPARGATTYATVVDAGTSFQSTRPRGARPPFLLQRPCSFWVSIHAPARGATMQDDRRLYWRVFQSTRPRGARQFREKRIDDLDCFNPRARAGRDRKRIRPPTS